MSNEQRAMNGGVFIWGWCLILALAGCGTLDQNFRAVRPGEFYRSGQMLGAQLAEKIRRHQVRTVINLRGTHPQEEWYRDEVAVCAAFGVEHHDLEWSMKELPAPESLAAFVTWCKQSEKPVLVHCQGGIHRAAVGSAVYLLTEGQDLEAARRQLGFFFRNAPIGRLLDLYESSGLPFETWVRARYPSEYERIKAATR